VSPSSPASQSQEVRKVPAQGLPIVDLLPPLDSARIEIPTPSGWSPLPRDSKYLVRFYKDDKNGLPRIEIIAEDKSYAGLETATEQNVGELARSVAKELEGQGKKLLEPVLPMVIGSTPCARYVLNVELKLPQSSIVAERQTLIVLRDKRVYTIQLLVLPKRLLADRDAAYAVCAGLKFDSPATDAPTKGN
jgi:hypothetical protein